MGEARAQPAAQLVTTSSFKATMLRRGIVVMAMPSAPSGSHCAMHDRNSYSVKIIREFANREPDQLPRMLYELGCDCNLVARVIARGERDLRRLAAPLIGHPRRFTA